MSNFEGFPKIPRLRRDCTISEKIDGTNAAVYIVPIEGHEHGHPLDGTPVPWAATVDGFFLYAQSRSRLICPTDDNFGFAAWVYKNADELVKLGPGRHFGEWYGAGIQRRYGLTEKRFALFNTARWGGKDAPPACCDVTPQLYIGPFGDAAVDATLRSLRLHGSYAAPGFMRPEGIVVYMHASRTLHKVTLEGDETPKGAQ